MRTSANRGLAVIGGAVIVICIIVAAVASGRTAAPRDPKSPEGVVQTYIEAVYAHDAKAALATLESGTECTLNNFDQTYVDRSSRVELVAVTTSGEDADVHIRIEHGNGDPFGGTWNEDQYLHLHRDGGAWRLTGQPWPVYNCGMAVK